MAPGDTRSEHQIQSEKRRWEELFGEKMINDYAAERKEYKEYAELFKQYKSLPEDIVNTWSETEMDQRGIWYRHTVEGHTSYNYWLNNDKGKCKYLLIAVRTEDDDPQPTIPTCFFREERPSPDYILNTVLTMCLLRGAAVPTCAAYALMSPGDDVPRVETNDPVLLSAIEYANRQNVADELKAYAFLARIYFLQYMELSERQRTKKLIYKTLMAKCEKKAFGDEVCFNYGLTSGEKGALRRRQNQLREAIQDKEAQKWFEFEWEENLYEYILASAALGDGMGFARDYACFGEQKRAVWKNFMGLLDDLD